MGLESFVRTPATDSFKQGEMLRAIGKGKLDGICLSLSSAYIHLRRNSLDPQDIMTMFGASYLRQVVAGIHEDYGTGKFSGGSKIEMQEETTIRTVFAELLKVLVKDRKASPRRALLNNAGDYPSGERPTIRRNLLSRQHDCRPKQFLIVFNCKNGRMGVTGAHAVVLDGSQENWGIFDPNYGWMQLQRGFNGIDVGVALNEFVAEYGITDAVAYQDFTNLT
jgi:hypothetical protein